MAETIAVRGSGQRLKKLREQLGRSPKEIARHLWLTITAYYKNENSEIPEAGTHK